MLTCKFLVEEIVQTADNFNMQELFPVLKSVFENKDLIFILLACIIMFGFIDYICHYKKKQPKKKIKKIVSAAPSPSAADDASSGAENTDSE